ncbi:MAG TPA: methylmalonyl-CoA mutase family protein [Candidatus Acidoferrum sp.]|nr:methylmalonyl-CoA mutase family protein [Candidatus Acidoferrum sp.]
MKDLEAQRQAWMAEIRKRTPPPALTPSGIPLEPSYGPESAERRDPSEIGYPGQYPYTRGLHATMYRGRLWTFRQYAGFGTAEDTNARYKFLLEQGQTGLSVALDLPTQMGYDSDDPRVEEEVGRVGVAIDTLADMEVIFQGLPLDKISTSFTINGTAAILLAMYLSLCERCSVPKEKINGTIQNDILKEYVSRGTWIYPAGPSLRLIVDTIEHCAVHAPNFNALSIAGAHFRDAGATAVQEMGYTLADAIAYLQACVDRGLDVDAIARQISFFFYTHMDFFEEVAKYRAGRRLWAKIMRERFGAKDPRSWMFRFGCVCGGSTLTVQQPLNNVVRVAYEAMAAVLGGVQSMFTTAYDEAFALPTEESAELALRTQQILAFETGVPSVADPLGGSWFIEALTDKMEAEIAALIQRVEKMGGMVAAIEEGLIQREIAQEAYRQQQRVESGEKVVVGVNRFARPEEPKVALYEPDPQILGRQRERLARVKVQRDAGRVAETLRNLTEAARGTANLMPFLIECVKAYCTVGEMNDALLGVFGRFREPIKI